MQKQKQTGETLAAPTNAFFFFFCGGGGGGCLVLKLPYYRKLTLHEIKILKNRVNFC